MTLPKFEDHITQAKRNLSFLERANASTPEFLDWQVTVCFYTAVHLVNAHLSLYGMQYRRHKDVNAALNPKDMDSINAGSSFKESEYLAYKKLQSLSRRSRYLINGDRPEEETACLIYDTHLAKSLRHLNTLIKFFTSTYKVRFQNIAVKCAGIKGGDLVFARP